MSKKAKAGYDYDDDDYDYDYDDYDDYDDYPKQAAPKAKATTPTKTVNNPNNKPNNNPNNNNTTSTKKQNNNKNAQQNNSNNTQQSQSQSQQNLPVQPLQSQSSKGRIVASQELCPTSFINEKNTTLSQLWAAQSRATTLSSHMLMIGHVDSGKSSLLGRLLLSQGRITNRTLESLQKEASQIGKGSFALAWVSDEQQSERARGITVDVASQWLSTPHRTVYVWDCPGHRDFVGNMLSAANHAKSAVLLISSRIGEFETGIGLHRADDTIKHQDGQTREHALLAFGSGVRNIIVAVNKMDDVNYDPERYLFICRETKKMLAKIGYDVSPSVGKVRFVPVSAMKNVNIGYTGLLNSLDKSSNSNIIANDLPAELSSWYKNGPSLVDMIDTLPSDNGLTSSKRDEFVAIPTSGSNPNPFSLAVHETFTHTIFGLSLHGKVLSGSCMVGEKIVLFPSGLVALVKGIECKSETTQGCFRGDVVTLNIKLQNDKAEIQTTMTTVLATDPYPPMFAKKIIAHIHTNMTMNAIPLIPGASLLIHSQHLNSLGTIHKIIHSYPINNDNVHTNHTDENTTRVVMTDTGDESGTKKVVKQRMITNNTVSVVEITLETPLPFIYLKQFKIAVDIAQQKNKIDPKSEAPIYQDVVDRICIRRDDETVATGIVMDVLEEQRYDFIA